MFQSLFLGSYFVCLLRALLQFPFPFFYRRDIRLDGGTGFHPKYKTNKEGRDTIRVAFAKMRRLIKKKNKTTERSPVKLFSDLSFFTPKERSVSGVVKRFSQFSRLIVVLSVTATVGDGYSPFWQMEKRKETQQITDTLDTAPAERGEARHI